MDKILSRISTAIASFSRAIFRSNNAQLEQAIIDANAQLPQIWFSEIPRCSLQCLYQPSLDLGCPYQDFNCICRAIEEVAEDQNVESCISSCPHNGDQRLAPGQILDFCDLVGEHIQLPSYMNQYAGLHRRQYSTRLVNNAIIYYSIVLYTEPDGGIGYSTVYESQPAETGYYTTSTSTTSSITAGTTVKVTSATSMMSATGSGSSEASSTGTGTGTGTSISSSSSSGLSTGAKIGIGVAVPLAVIILVLGLFWYLRKRNQNKKDSAPTSGDDNLPEVTDKSWSNKKPKILPPEADGNPLSEADSNSILPPQSVVASPQQTPGLYELSGNPAPPSGHNLGGSLAARSLSETYFRGTSNTVSRKAISSTLSSSPGPETSTIVNGTGGLASSQQLSEKQETGAELAHLETEMARIREQRERLQQLNLLEEQEDQLKKRIAALKAGGSSV